MSKYYCHECALKLGLITNHDNTNFTGSFSPQLEKFIKHTQPLHYYNINSIFDKIDYLDYKDYIVNTLASGSVEIDNKNRTNIVWVAGKTTGVAIINNQLDIPVDAVKVVLQDDVLKIHAFATGSLGLRQETCIECGCIIVN